MKKKPRSIPRHARQFLLDLMHDPAAPMNYRIKSAMVLVHHNHGDDATVVPGQRPAPARQRSATRYPSRADWRKAKTTPALRKKLLVP